MQPQVKPDRAHSALAPDHAICDARQMNLQAIRMAKNLTQKDLADMLGVDKATISRAEAMAPSAMLKTYIDAAAALNVTLGTIFADNWGPDEAAIVALFRTIPDEQKARLRQIVELAAAPLPRASSAIE